MTAKNSSANTYVVDNIKDEKELNELTQYGLDYAHCIGLVCRSDAQKYESYSAETAPMTLLPSPFPKELYDIGVAVQKTLSELYFRISMDADFLREAYKEVVKTDEMKRREMEMMEKVLAEGVHQDVVVSLMRADYLAHHKIGSKQMELKQVEVNIGQIGGMGHATCCSMVHKRVLGKLEINHGGLPPQLSSTVLPENRPMFNMAETLYKAWKLFGDPKAVVVFMNQSDLFPVCHFEQLKCVVYELESLARADGHLLNVLRMTIVEAATRLHLDEKDFSLYADGNKRVGLIHQAYGYMLDHFPTDKEWKMRLDMERSSAVLSPNMRVQLSSSKKIQQMLAKPGALEHFLPDAKPEVLQAIRHTQMGLWGLDSQSKEVAAAMEEAISAPEHFVLKSQLEAGKGNFFNEEIREKLKSMSEEERAAYILMQKINPVVMKNYMVRPYKGAQLQDIVSELSIYGSLIGSLKSKKVSLNTVDGHLVRTKPAYENQGGVCAGTGVIDSVLLFPSDQFST